MHVKSQDGEENLLNTYACYLCTTTDLVVGVLSVHNAYHLCLKAS